MLAHSVYNQGAMVGRNLAYVALVVTACATAVSLQTVDQWRADLKGYEGQLQKFSAESVQMLDEFEALRADSSFSAVEAKMKDLAARAASEGKTNGQELIVPSFSAMSLGELLVFRKFLALSTRKVTLEATQAELQRQRLDLRLRRLKLEGELHSGDLSLLDQPVAIPFSCASYLVGDIEFANCQ